MIRGLGLLVVGGIFVMLLSPSTVELARSQAPSGTPSPAPFPVTVAMASPDGRDLGTAVIAERASGIVIELAVDRLDAGQYELGIRSVGSCEAGGEAFPETAVGTVTLDERGDGQVEIDPDLITVEGGGIASGDSGGSALVMNQPGNVSEDNDEPSFVACGVIFPSAEATPMPGSPVAGGVEDVVIVSVDIAFEPNEVVIPANTDVRFTLPNDGTILHTFSIDELGIDIFQSPGDVHEIVVNAPPGEYVFYCKIEGHREAGMVGTLIVE